MRVMATRLVVRFITGSPGQDHSGFMRETIEGRAPSRCATALTEDLNVRRDHLAIIPEDVFAAATQMLRNCKATSVRQYASAGLQRARVLVIKLATGRAFMGNSQNVIPTIGSRYLEDQPSSLSGVRGRSLELIRFG
jgi:hypothetical protein